MGKTIKKNRTLQRAVKIFTDRVEPRNAFWNAYEEYKKTMNDENAEAKVISYYGMGGIGKSRLLTQLKEELESRRESYCVKVDLAVYNGMHDGLRYIQQVLRKYRFSFPLYAAGVIRRAKLEQNVEKIDIDRFRSYLGETADDFFDMVQPWIGWMPVFEYIPKVARSVTKVANCLNAIIDERKYAEDIREIQGITDIAKLDQLLPVLLGKDIGHNMAVKKEPLVIFFDTYEKLVDELANIESVYTKDDWLKGDDGLISNTPNTLWVIAGREKLKWAENDSDWENNLEQHLMESLSESDATEYLVAAGIPVMLQHDLYELAHGVPLLLDLSVDTYYRIQERGEEPTIDKFGHDEQTIVERYIRYMDSFQKKIMYKMAFLRKWPTNDIRIFKHEDGAFDPIQFSSLEQSSCINEVDGMSILHEVVGETLRKVCSPTLKEQLCGDLLAYFKENLSNIEKDAPGEVYLMTTAATVALDYYAPEKVGDFFNGRIWPEIDRLAKKMDQRWMEICETIYQITTKKLGGEHLVAVKAMHEMARSLRGMGKYQEALGLAEKVLETCRRLDDRHSRTTAAMNNVAIILRKLGRYQESLDLAEKVLERCRTNYSDEDFRTVAAMESLARSQEALGYGRQPFELRHEAMEICQRVFGDTDPNTISAMLNWSRSLIGCFQYKDAYEVVCKVLEFYRRTKGEDDFSTCSAMGTLAFILNRLARYEDACKMQKKVVEVLENTLTKNHPDTLAAKYELAEFLGNLGRHQEAHDLSKEVLEVRKDILSENHPDTLDSMESVAMTLYALGQNQTGVNMEKAAVEKRIIGLGDSHPSTLGGMNHLMRKLRELGREEEAREWEEKFWNRIHEMNTPEALECEEKFFSESKFWNAMAESDNLESGNPK